MGKRVDDVAEVSRRINTEVRHVADQVYERGFQSSGPDAVHLNRDQMIALFKTKWPDREWRMQELERYAPEGPAGRPEAGLDAFFTLARAAYPQGYTAPDMGGESNAGTPTPMPSDRGGPAGLGMGDAPADTHLPTAPSAADHAAAVVGGPSAPGAPPPMAVPAGMAPPTAGPAGQQGSEPPAPAGLM